MSLTKKIPADHFEGGKNLTKGGQHGKPGQDLATAIRTLEAEGQVLQFTSAAGAGGAATEAMTLTGLKATDEILGVSQKIDGANNLPLLGWSTQADDALTGIWSADPGANAIIQVMVKRVPAS